MKVNIYNIKACVILIVKINILNLISRYQTKSNGKLPNW